MASDIGWGGLPFMYPSKTAMHYLLHAHSVIPEDEVPPGSHYRARQDMLQNVRGYKSVKKGLERRILDIERERRRAQSADPTFISTSGVSASYLTNGYEHHAPMNPVFYHEKSCCFRNTGTRCPVFRRKIQIGYTEPRQESVLGMMDIRRRLTRNPCRDL